MFETGFGDSRPGGLSETYEAKILLCYLLRHVPSPLTYKQLLEAATQDDLINYFLFSDALKSLLSNGQIAVLPHEDGDDRYVLTEEGGQGADQFQTYVPRALRDRIVEAAVRMLARIRREREVICELIPLEDGFHVHCRLLDLGSDLLDVKIFAPDKPQADLIRRKLLGNPSAFYGKLMDFCLENSAEED